MNQPEDKKILNRVRAGDTSAYAEIVRRYQPRILQLCLSILSDEKEAEDAAQEVFVKVFYSLNKFQEKSSFYTWLYRVASNYCLDLGRKKSRRKTQSLDELMEKPGAEFEKNHLSRPEDESGDFQEQVNYVLALMTPEEKMVLVLREIQGLSYEEMSVALQCTLDAVKGRLKRARQEFKEKMRHFLNREGV